jgi:plasmid maintenance system antidote protein VapI
MLFVVRSQLLKAMKLAELRSIEIGDPQRWTVARLAREAGLDRGTIQTLIDAPEKSTLGTAAKVAAVLGVTIADLVELVEVEELQIAPAVGDTDGTAMQI